MSLEAVGISVGAVSMTIAAIAVWAHYRSERRRASVLRSLENRSVAYDYFEANGN